MDIKDYIGAADAAALAGVSEQTIRRVAGDGKLKAIKWGSRWLTTRKWVIAWMGNDKVHRTDPLKRNWKEMRENA